MMFDNIRRFWKVFETWARKIIIVLLIPALGIFAWLLVLESKPSYSYEHPENSDKRIIQQITCPSLMVRDKPWFATAVIHENVTGTEPTITTSIDASNFDIHDEATSVHENLSDNGWLTPMWFLSPKETGDHTVIISAVTDNGLSDKATCEITVIYLLGLELKTVYQFDGAIIGLGIVFGIQSLRERKKQGHSPNQEAG